MTEPVPSGPGRFPRGAGAPDRSVRSVSGADAPVSDMTVRHIYDCQAYRPPTLSSVEPAVGVRSPAGAAR
ncbi:hypothetical protein GCM10027259_32140 [Micromonospora palomenae]